MNIKPRAVSHVAVASNTETGTSIVWLSYTVSMYQYRQTGATN